MIESFRELDLAFFSITETWLKSTKQTVREIKDLSASENICLLTKNRKSRGGGVALAFDMSEAHFKIEKIRDNKFEILCCAGKIRNIERKVVVYTVYLPPKMTASDVQQLSIVLSDSIEHQKTKHADPVFVISGDFNRKDISAAFQDFPEISQVRTPPSRSGACLDLCYTNAIKNVTQVSSLPPLESNDNLTTSDHNVLVFRLSFWAVRCYKARTVTFRPYTKRGEETFTNLMLQTDWSFVETGDSNTAAEVLTTRLEEYTNKAFPEKTKTFKSTDRPWTNPTIKTLTRKKKREYASSRRSARWIRLNEQQEERVKEAKNAFFEKMKIKASEAKNSKEYFKAIKVLLCPDQSEHSQWNIRDLFPGKSDSEAAEETAAFFNKISSEYTPITPGSGIDCSPLCPEMYEIAARLKHCKKPRSMVKGDILPKLVTKFADILAIPLHYIFRISYASGSWPSLWKTETVTAIPKCPRPTSLSELRNLSCTPLFSKVMEFFLLKKLKEEVKLENTQFGGIKGSSVEHFLIETWQEILTGLEDSRAAVSLASIDFQKAFNRMCHHECLKAARELGASEHTCQMLRAFLSGRKMTVKVNGQFSILRGVDGGSPQGCLLGNYLFCITTNQLNRCVDEANNQQNVTLELSQNGADATHSSPARSDRSLPSPIAKPMTDLELGSASEEEEIYASNFLYFNQARRIDDSEELSFVASQEEINRALGTPAGWEDRDITIKVYIDDLNAVEKILQTNAVSAISQTKRKLKVHSPRTERLFESINEKSRQIKMQVNQAKTQILCISASSSDSVSSYIRPKIDGEVTETRSGDHLKIVGFHFDEKPSVACHIRHTCAKFRSGLWSLRKLKHIGMGEDDLMKIYKSTLRSVVEFASVVYGPMLTSAMETDIESLQLRATKIIFGPYVSYRTVLEETELETLTSRREKSIEKFAKKTLKNERFSSKWFPEAPPTDHNTRFPKRYLEERCRTSRLYNSPMYMMRRIINDS